jgi:hypothetical protein
MIKMSSDQNQLVEELPGQAGGERVRQERAREHFTRRRDSVEGGNDDEEPNEIAAEISVAEPVAVRETGLLYRLKGARFVAVVAADTEQEARLLAAAHDALRGDWRNPQFASAEFEDTGEAHVFGDVVISALAVSPFPGPKKGR